MNFKSLALLVSAVALLGACGGDKQEPADGGTALLTRTNGNTTQMALVDGNFDQEGAQAYYEANKDKIAWTDINNFQQDDELQLAADNNVQQTARGHNNGGHQGGKNRGHRRVRHGHHHHGHWRPYRTHRHRWHRHRWHKPRFNYWGYNHCGMYRMYWNGRCVRPYSPAYGNYGWQPYHGWNAGGWNTTSNYQTTSTSGWWVSVWF